MGQLTKVHEDFTQFGDGLPGDGVYMEACLLWKGIESGASRARPRALPKRVGAAAARPRPSHAMRSSSTTRSSGGPPMQTLYPKRRDAPAPSSASLIDWGRLSGARLWRVGAATQCSQPNEALPETSSAWRRRTDDHFAEHGEGSGRPVRCLAYGVARSFAQSTRAPTGGVLYQGHLLPPARPRSCTLPVGEPLHESDKELPLPSFYELRSRPCRHELFRRCRLPDVGRCCARHRALHGHGEPVGCRTYSSTEAKLGSGLVLE